VYKYGVEIKKDLSLSDLLRLVRLSEYAKELADNYSNENPGRIRRVFLYISTYKKIIWVKQEMVKILTCARFPFLSMHKLARIQNELGLNAEPDKSSKDPEEAIQNVAIHLAAEMGLTPQDVLGGTTIKQAEKIHFRLEMQKLEKAIQAALSYHANPKDYIKQLQRDIRDMQQKERQVSRKPTIGDKPKVVQIEEVRQMKESDTTEYKIRNMLKY